MTVAQKREIGAWMFIATIAIIVTFVMSLSGCSNANMPRTTIMGVQVGGGSTYCTALSAGVGAVGGGLLGGFFAPASVSTGTAPSVGWTTALTFIGAAAGAATGYLACGPTTSATKASEPNEVSAN